MQTCTFVRSSFVPTLVVSPVVEQEMYSDDPGRRYFSRRVTDRITWTHVRQMIPETAFLTIDIRAPIMWTRMLFAFAPLIISNRIVPRGRRAVLGLLLLSLPLLRILIEKGLTEVSFGPKEKG